MLRLPHTINWATNYCITLTTSAINVYRSEMIFPDVGAKMANSGYILPDRRRLAVLDGTNYLLHLISPQSRLRHGLVLRSINVQPILSRDTPHHSFLTHRHFLSLSLKERYGCTRHQLVMSFTLHQCSCVTEYQ